MATASPESLRRALFSPETVALIGASANPDKSSGRVQRYLRRHGFKGRLVLVNPERREIDGERCYGSIEEIDVPVDHAFVLVGTSRVEEAVKACVAKGAKVATILAGGFSESGQLGNDLQRRVVAAAREGGMRLLGPNSMGIVNLHAATALCANAALDVQELLPGPLGLVSQSGSVLGTMLSRGQARGIGFSKLISTGNEADLSAGEIADLLVDDPDTHAILLFLEAVRDPVHLAHMARRAQAAGKPVIAYKLGRSDAGRELATSHTGAIAGADAAADAFFREHGIARVDMIESLIELPYLMMGADLSRPRRKQVAVMTTTGGGGAMVVDQLSLRSVEALAPAPQTRECLLSLGIETAGSRLVDLTLAGTTKEHAQAALAVLLAGEESEVVIPVIGSSAQFKPELALAGVLAAAQHNARRKPIGVFLVPHADESLRILAGAGIAGFRTPETAADCVRAFLECRPPSARDAVPAVSLSSLQRILQAGGQAGSISPERASDVFRRLGIRQVASFVLRDFLMFEDLPTDLSYPLAVKVISADIQHKTEAGAVALNISGRGELELAVRKIVESALVFQPSARIDGIGLQGMEKGLAEVVLGFRRDPQIGPIVVLGAGGVLTEIYRDFATRLAPTTREEALAMIDEVKGLAPIRGYRGLPRGDLDALADAVVAMSRLALLDEPIVTEAEINPLIVKRAGEGVVAVDALVTTAEYRMDA
ncbi:acetate--CoA ligase family protein [Mesorhizobium sp. AD1-1]|uniref:acetate--CoA ligase family protein n=1 Tax=Mesorhizobium sp. AD1-1 TaxID=2876621 RepID=UPI001CCF500E|nr:acetate--CoA ligase family protein [Mesorhizobium sp. AD1-1]MBZ9719209.1 acetate--CoA ligase family protein [Mesorhizobium sp. AD1-1]